MWREKWLIIPSSKFTQWTPPLVVLMYSKAVGSLARQSGDSRFTTPSCAPASLEAMARFWWLVIQMQQKNITQQNTVIWSTNNPLVDLFLDCLSVLMSFIVFMVTVDSEQLHTVHEHVCLGVCVRVCTRALAGEGYEILSAYILRPCGLSSPRALLKMSRERRMRERRNLRCYFRGEHLAIPIANCWNFWGRYLRFLDLFKKKKNILMPAALAGRTDIAFWGSRLQKACF